MNRIKLLSDLTDKQYLGYNGSEFEIKLDTEVKAGTTLLMHDSVFAQKIKITGYNNTTDSHQAILLGGSKNWVMTNGLVVGHELIEKEGE